MRTTVILNDKLLAEAKRLAASRNTTLSELLNEALRERLHRQPGGSSDTPVRVPVFRGQGAVVDSRPEDLSRIGQDETLQAYRP